MENLDLRKILKDIPKGTKLYSTICGYVEFDKINNDNDCYPIICYKKDNLELFTKEGKYNYYHDGECCLFPSKENRDWSKFITKPFQNGDVISSSAGCIAIFSHYSSTNAIVYHCVVVNDGIIIKQDTGIGYHRNCHLASRKEKSKLYDLLQEAGYFWNDETNSLEKYKFKKGDTIQDKKTKQILTIYDVEHNKYKTCKCLPCYIIAKHQNQFELCQEKFDITTLKTYDKILVRFGNNSVWEPQLFSRLDINLNHHVDKFVIIGFCSVPQCIPYEGNEHLAGTTNDCNDYYKTWE